MLEKDKAEESETPTKKGILIGKLTFSETGRRHSARFAREKSIAFPKLKNQ